MTSAKKFHFLLTLSTFLLTVCKVHAQKIDEKTYQHKMRLMDSLSYYKMKDYDTLYKLSLSYNLYGNQFDDVYYGWIQKQNKENVLFLGTDGKEIEIKKKQITQINQLLINDTTIDIFIKTAKDPFKRPSFGEDYSLCLWLYKKAKFDYSKRLLPENDKYFNDESIRDDFGIVYYDAMLSAFSRSRDYRQAIAFGNHLCGNIFNGYEYQKTALALTLQLKKDTGDFKSFHIPDSLEWTTLKLQLDRKEQIHYLADRLKLLNCIQPGQPGGISYAMPQLSISFSQASKLGILYWVNNTRYGVINPFIELIKMKLNLQEMKLLLPYLLSDNYIASYSYFRDFRSERTLHKQSWVIHDLIFEITNNHFFYDRPFDSLSFNQKKVEVEKIEKWCDENTSLSKEDLIINTLRTTDDWNDFKEALETAKNEKYKALLPTIIGRYNDFKNFYWPVQKDLIAKTMYEFGDKKYIETVKQWSKDTTGVRDTTALEGRLWTSLFLLKYDPASYEYAMQHLEFVLRKCDGTAYYPSAMDLLLSIKNNERAFKLAEGILTKEGFRRAIYWDYNLNFVKKLLLLKSDYTFNFISSKLGSFTTDEVESFKKNNNKNMLMQSDFYVLAVDKLKGDKQEYDPASDFETRLKYKKALSEWFITQYNLFKNGQPNELHLDIANVNASVGFVDAPGN
jgi:hypothetical protein